MLVIARHNGFEYILATVDSTEAALPEDHFPDDAPGRYSGSRRIYTGGRRYPAGTVAGYDI